MQADLTRLFEEYKTTKKFKSLDIQYGGKSSTDIQLSLERFNTLTMDEVSSVLDHVNHTTHVTKIC